MNYRELKAKDQEKDNQPYSIPSQSFAEYIRSFPFKIFNKIIYLFDINRLKVHTKFGLIRLLDYPARKIYIRVTSPEEYNRLRACYKEPWTVEWIENFIQAEDVLFDIGANIGAYSLVTAKLREGNIKVVAIEPSFSNFSSLCYNIVLNNCQNSIIPLQIALSSQTALTQFNYSNLEAGSALHILGDPVYFTGVSLNAVYQQSILSYKLDDLINQFNLPIPNHIKLDVDGPELDVLSGAQQTLSHPNMRSLMVELNESMNKSDETIVDFLESQGFHLKARHIRLDERGMRKPYSFCIFGRASH